MIHRIARTSMENPHLFSLVVLLFPLCLYGGPRLYLCSAASNSTTLSGRAGKMTRSLNLLPQTNINMVPPMVGTTSRPSTQEIITEKRFYLPYQTGESGAPSDDLGHYAGYYPIRSSHASRLFYFFFQSRANKADPVVLWLTGGPGCSSQLALFYENGPFSITPNLSLVLNTYGWETASHLIYVDQPTGTGFSYTSDERDIRTNEEDISNDMYGFLQAFFQNHSQFLVNDFYVTGESYAGHYIPALASRIRNGNNNKEGLHINLKGIAIGNGMTHPIVQYKAYPDYALQMNVITESDYESIQSLVPSCEASAILCERNATSCTNAREECDKIFDAIMANSNMNYYDIRKQCTGSMCYDFSNIERFLGQKEIKDALGVPSTVEFVSCSTKVYNAMTNDWMRNLAVDLPPLLEDGIQLLIYAGEYDLICNWIGNSRWVHQMEWSGQKNFTAAPNVSFIVDGNAAGVMKSFGPLIFVKIRDAGHMVPMDQPKASLDMFQRWLKGKLAA